MIDILVANEFGRLLCFPMPDDEPLPEELTVPIHRPIYVNGGFAGWEPSTSPRRWRHHVLELCGPESTATLHVYMPFTATKPPSPPREEQMEIPL